MKIDFIYIVVKLRIFIGLIGLPVKQLDIISIHLKEEILSFFIKNVKSEINAQVLPWLLRKKIRPRRY